METRMNTKMGIKAQNRVNWHCRPEHLLNFRFKSYADYPKLLSDVYTCTFTRLGSTVPLYRRQPFFCVENGGSN